MNINFSVAYADGPKNKIKTEVARKVPQWEKEGIEVPRYMRHPTCPFCGLIDLGKDAPVRPSEIHMLACEKRRLGPKPYIRIDGVMTSKIGVVKGEGSCDSLRFPVRLVRPIEDPVLDNVGNPVLDEAGRPEVDRRFLCSYKWKTAQVNNWVWNGTDWVPWYVWGKR